ncbi:MULTISPECIES: B3/B4 domain-containing protein [Peptostreptococcaceae]|uniref:B3/B4 domain-containing protein n=1 Tax=Peptostreptococcaceae TaxID=186804 RepID=UPI000E4F466C|nr:MULTISPECIES: phenylalanine--tRNA ligase beta subunit-related protein [Peptostreptococcaceae]MCH1959477.1 hypothetical protein [Romboutsia hominis]RGX04659.1 hypothetical protein DWV40_13545 [Paeniclostridium sordellii]
MKIKIDNKIKEICPNIHIGTIVANITVTQSSKELINLIDITCETISNSLTTDKITSIPNIEKSRQAYLKLGKSPSRYRLSSEALLRRVVKGSGLYLINNIVEINNLISIKSGWSLGSYDLSNTQGEIFFTIGEDGESYKGIGKDNVNIENLPVFADTIGKFGSTTSDSTRAMITEKTKSIMMNIISFDGKEGLNEYLNEAKELLIKYANAEILEININN